MKLTEPKNIIDIIVIFGCKQASKQIKLTKNTPNTAWKNASPREYGFYSNVNPEVDHPRWSQATE